MKFFSEIYKSIIALGFYAPWVSNANGRYLKLPNGTLICRATITENRPIATAFTGGGFRDTASVTYTFPLAFIDTNFEITFSVGFTSNAIAYIENRVNRTSSTMQAIPLAITSQAAADRTFSYIAVGRWK